MGRLFGGSRAPSTIGTFLRAFTFGRVRQLGAVASRFLTALAVAAPILRGGGVVAYVDIDDTVREVHGHAKQGAGFGYSGGARPECADRDSEHADVGADDRGDPAAQGLDRFGTRRRRVGRRGPGHGRRRPGRAGW